MSDQKIVAGGMSAEEVTLKLLHLIANAEGKSFNAAAGNAPSRAWILDTFAQCSLAVNNGWGSKDIFRERPLSQ